MWNLPLRLFLFLFYIWNKSRFGYESIFLNNRNNVQSSLYAPQRSLFRKCIGAHIKLRFKNYMKMWGGPKYNVQAVVFHRRQKWIYGGWAAKKHSWLFMAARFSVAAQSRVSFSSFVFAHVYAFAKVAQTVTMGTTPVKNEPLFIEFTFFHVSSRRDFHPAGADSFFRSYDSPGT